MGEFDNEPSELEQAGIFKHELAVGMGSLATGAVVEVVNGLTYNNGTVSLIGLGMMALGVITGLRRAGYELAGFQNNRY